MAKLIFHVDDSAEWRSIVEKIVVGEGYALQSFSGTEEMFEAMKKDSPDLILLDVMVEEVDSGLVAFDKEYPDIPIIIITSLGEMIQSHFEMKSRIPAFIEKPITPEVLKASMQAYLK